MPIPSGFVPKAGKQQLMASFNNFLVSQLDGGEVHDGAATSLPLGKTFWWLFGYPLTTLMFPSISVVEVGLFNKGEFAIGRLLGFESDGTPIKGTRNQTLVEINCWAKDTDTKADAEKVVRELRDRIIFALTNAGQFDETTNGLLIPPIELKNYNVIGNPKVGLINIDPSDNAINEKFIVDSVDANIKRYKLLVRIFWFELSEPLP